MNRWFRRLFLVLAMAASVSLAAHSAHAHPLQTGHPSADCVVCHVTPQPACEPQALERPTPLLQDALNALAPLFTDVLLPSLRLSRGPPTR